MSCAACRQPIQRYELTLTRDDGSGRVLIHAACLGLDLAAMFQPASEGPSDSEPGDSFATGESA